MNAVKLLAIATVTVAVTLLCIRSGQAMAKSSASAGTVYHSTDGIQEARSKLLTATKASTMTSTVNTTMNTTASAAFSIAESTTDIALNDSGTIFTTPVATKITVDLNGPAMNGTRDAEEREQTPKNATSRALVEGKGHQNRSSRSRSPSIVVRGKLIKTITHPIDHYGENPDAVAVDDDSDGEEDNDHADNNDADIVVDTEVYRANRYKLVFS